MKPTKEELLSLKTVLVKNNKIIPGVEMSEGYWGRGGSNSSPYEDTLNITQSLDELSGKKIKKVGVSEVRYLSYGILAVVDDVIYLGEFVGGNSEIIEIPHNDRFVYSTEIAYDTELSFCVKPITEKSAD